VKSPVEEEEEPGEQPPVRNSMWLKINDRTKLIRHRCEVGIGSELMEKALAFMAKAMKPEKTRESLVALLGEENIAYWHLLDQLLFYEELQKSIPAF
jgi:NIMA (never in mitosis gene a)-related kinase